MADYFDTPYAALMLDEVEDYEYVIHELTKFIDIGQKIGPALHNRAQAYWEIGRNEEALAGFDAAIASLPSSHMPSQYKGVMLHKLGRTNEALAALDLAVSIFAERSNTSKNERLHPRGSRPSRTVAHRPRPRGCLGAVIPVHSR